MRFGIPYQLVGGVRFYERREVKDALAYVRLARNPADRVALGRIINVPARGIGAKTVEELSAWAESRGTSACGRRCEAAGENPNLATRSRAQLGVFAELMRGLMAMAATEPPSAIFDAALERSGLQAAIQDGTDDGEERWANLHRAAQPRGRVRRDRRARGARPLPRGGGARQRPGRAGGRARPGDADHAPRGQGARVPGRLHRRHGGGAAAAPPRARGRARARGGAAPRVRRA